MKFGTGILYKTLSKNRKYSKIGSVAVTLYWRS